MQIIIICYYYDYRIFTFLTHRRARDNYPKNRCFGKKVTPEKGEAYYEWLNYEQID